MPSRWWSGCGGPMDLLSLYAACRADPSRMASRRLMSPGTGGGRGVHAAGVLAAAHSCAGVCRVGPECYFLSKAPVSVFKKCDIICHYVTFRLSGRVDMNNRTHVRHIQSTTHLLGWQGGDGIGRAGGCGRSSPAFRGGGFQTRPYRVHASGGEGISIDLAPHLNVIPGPDYPC